MITESVAPGVAQPKRRPVLLALAASSWALWIAFLVWIAVTK